MALWPPRIASSARWRRARTRIRSCSASSACSKFCSRRCTPASPGAPSTWLSRRSRPAAPRSRAPHTAKTPDIRWRIADMALAYDALPMQIATIAHDVDAVADRGASWFFSLSGLKHRAVVMSKHVVDDAMLVAGGSSYFTRNELSRLYRDVLAGMFHPSDPESAHATAAALWLGPIQA
ncbi:acyl-CoA dehydrogenase family protein [Propioniciclava flava]